MDCEQRNVADITQGFFMHKSELSLKLSHKIIKCGLVSILCWMTPLTSKTQSILHGPQCMVVYHIKYNPSKSFHASSG